MIRYFLKLIFFGFYALIVIFFSHAQNPDLHLSADDLLIELRGDGGYHLFIRFRPGISSVLLTESARDPLFLANNYAFRAEERNAINGNEIRLIDGFPIPAESGIYSLISSTPVWHDVLGWAFHIYIPYRVIYGYEGGRHGYINVGDGTHINIRAFEFAFADYRGRFADNPFTLRIMQEQIPAAIVGAHLPETVAAFISIAGENAVFSTGPADLVDHIQRILEREKGKNVDIVICFDATGSMRPHVDAVRDGLIPMMNSIITEFESFRIGMVLFRDYHEEFLTRIIPFTDDFGVFQHSLNAIRVAGGGDIPEAVYEALFDGATRFPWTAESRIMILIGDAPPHPRPRGRITRAMVDREIAERDIDIHAIILPEIR